MVFRLLAVLAEFERDLVGERTRLASAHKRSRGERWGQVPYGRSLAADGRALVADDGGGGGPGDHPASSGPTGWSLRAIAAELTGRGHPDQERVRPLDP